MAAITLLCAFALAGAQCDLSNDPVTLSIAGFGTAHFQEFATDEAGSIATLSGGVCIVGEGGMWTIMAERAVISGLRSGQQLRAHIAEPTLLLAGWRVVARQLESDEASLELAEVNFSGHGVAGSAQALTMATAGGVPVATGVNVLGEGFRLSAQQARITADAVDLDVVVITTCTCPGDPFYTVSGRGALLELEEQRLEVAEGQLEVAGLRVPLGERFELSGERLQELAPPVTLEYRPEAGTGIGLVVPRLELEEGLALEMGILGLDAPSPLQGFALLHYRDESVDLTVGRARGGPRADFEVVQLVSPHLEAAFAVHNRHEPRSHYLHEGLLELRSDPPAFELTPTVAFDVHGRAFAAVSSQQLAGEAVISPRLGLFGAGSLRAALGPHRLVWLLEGESTAYPPGGEVQYGVRVRPSWSFRQEPWALDVAWDRRWTNSASPFSTRLDRLVPRSVISARARASGGLGGSLTGSFTVDVDYDLLKVGGADGDGLDRLGAEIELTQPLGEWTMSLESRLELAGLLDPDVAGDREAFVEAGMTGVHGAWEVGSRVRYELRPNEQALSLLEASVAVPLEFEDGTLTPFLALDFVPLLFHAEPPRLSGHGVDFTWRSCCGTLRMGYRQQGDEFVTSFGIALDR